MTDTSVEQVKRSILKECAAVFDGVDISAYYFDAKMANAELPSGDLYGLKTLSLTQRKPTVGSVSIGVATSTDDTNLFRLDQYAGLLFDHFVADYLFPLYNADGDEIGTITILPETTISPRYDSESRPLKFVYISFGTTLA